MPCLRRKLNTHLAKLIVPTYETMLTLAQKGMRVDKLRALETFIAVAEAGSFAAASRKLNVSAPSVTRIIGDLEADLGVKLLNRTTRIVTLTGIGQRYVEDAKQITSELSAADDAAKGAHRDPTGTLRITASTMFGKLYITPIITEYLNLYPEVKIEALFVDRVVNLFEEGLDIAVRIGNLADSSMMASRVGEVGFQVCGSPQYLKERGVPKEPEDLNAHNLIGLDLGGFQNAWKFNNGLTFKPEYRMAINSVPARLEAARSGWGLVRVLSYQIAAEVDSGSLQTVLQKYMPPPFPVHLLHGQGRQSSAKVRTFIDLATKRLRADPFLN